MATVCSDECRWCSVFENDGKDIKFWRPAHDNCLHFALWSCRSHFKRNEVGFCPKCGSKLYFLEDGTPVSEPRAELEAKAAALDKLEGEDLEWNHPYRYWRIYREEGVYDGDTLLALADALPDAP